MSDASCAGCRHWITARKSVYEDGTEIVSYLSQSGRGSCGVLGIDTAPTFGCNQFTASDGHEQINRKSGSPWHHFVMIPCPDCGGRGSEAPASGVVETAIRADNRCAGTGFVRLYDDGHIGDERTRKHPKEIEIEQAQAHEKERARAQAILDGLPLEVDPEVIDGTVLKPIPKASVLGI